MQIVGSIARTLISGKTRVRPQAPHIRRPSYSSQRHAQTLTAASLSHISPRGIRTETWLVLQSGCIDGAESFRPPVGGNLRMIGSLTAAD